MEGTGKISHSVTLDEDKCVGCTNCIKRCPTEAIRVRNGKAQIIAERCIDCGMCIRVCPHHAKKAVFDKLEGEDGLRKKFKYLVALPAPSLYGQFNNLTDMDYVLTGLLDIGFDDVFEVSRGAELVSEYTRRLMEEGSLKKPIISSACPATVRLIRIRFPHLCSHVLPVAAPYIVAAKLAREEAIRKSGLKSEEIGIVFISPCPAKATDSKNPVGMAESGIDGVLAISDVYKKLVPMMNKIEVPKSLSKSGILGISWGSAGGEASALLKDNRLAADGIENVIQVLEEVEDDKLSDTDFIELNACTAGCIGGSATMTNPFVVQTRMQRLRKYLPVSMNKLEDFDGCDCEMAWDEDLEYAPIMQLDSDRSVALKKMQEIDRIVKDELPRLDCGSCGAPSCRAFAEDVVQGLANINDCIFVLRKKIGRLYTDMTGMDTFGGVGKDRD